MKKQNACEKVKCKFSFLFKSKLLENSKKSTVNQFDHVK